MAFFLLILLLIICNDLKLSGPGEFHSGYLDKDVTTSVNGIFVVLVVFSHYAQYADLGGIYDEPYLMLKRHLGQLVVATFMFYSGYGMMEQIKARGAGYVRALPGKMLKLLVRFDCAVLLFLAVDHIVAVHYDVRQILLAFTTWEGVGNSNWYITAILFVYLFIYISFVITRPVRNGASYYIAAAILTALTVTWVYVMMRIGRPSYTYNTIILAPVGLIYSLIRARIDALVMKNGLTYSAAVLAAAAAYVISFLAKSHGGIEVYTVWAVSFVLLILLTSMKARICNGALLWLGRHVFSIYILQRIPMILLSYTGFIEAHRYIGLIAVFLATIPLAIAFEAVTDRIIRVPKQILS